MDIQNMPIDIRDIPEVEENPYHPLNDQFHQQTQHLQNLIMSTQRLMKPKHVQVVKMRFAGMKNTDIADKVELAAGTISNIAAREDAQRLHTLLIYLDGLTAGPTTAHRIAVLNRIMVDNEKKNPKVALQAIAEMNKMDMNKHNMEKDVGVSQTTIIINENHFPRTPLDG